MSVNTSVRIPDEMHERLVAEAARLDRSMGWLIVKSLQGTYGDHALEAASGGETTDPQSPMTTGDPGSSRVPASPPAHGAPSPRRHGGGS
jgi:hypothetical protein